MIFAQFCVGPLIVGYPTFGGELRRCCCSCLVHQYRHHCRTVSEDRWAAPWPLSAHCVHNADDVVSACS